MGRSDSNLREEHVGEVCAFAGPLANLSESRRKASNTEFLLALMGIEKELLNHFDALKHDRVGAVGRLLSGLEPEGALAELIAADFRLLKHLFNAANFLGIGH